MTKEKKRINKFIISITSWKFRFFLIFKLPLAYIAGLKIQKISSRKAIVSVPFSFWNKNPFNSIYFAVLAMAGEFSTGILGLLHTNSKDGKISMLVVKMESHFYKKATGKIKFICDDGEKISSSIQKAINSGNGVVVKTKSKGYNKDGICVCEFNVYWSFKSKNK